MKILIIGGTKFLGRQLVDSALARGHELTLFNRGKTNPNLFPQVETLIGDREYDIAKLASAGRQWDAVIDVAAYLPRIVQLSASSLREAGSVSRYVFISSISVYADFKKIGLDETYPLAKMPEGVTDENNLDAYGARKALCEQIVQETFGQDRALIIRPGLIVGPHDPTDRFTYWPMRVARGGEVLAPEKPDVPVQIIDVRDLSEFTIKLIEANASGVFNATGPNHELTLGALLEACKEVSGSGAQFKWASVEFLKENKVEAWSDMPVWVPDTEEDAGFSRMDISRAIRAGLTFRPLRDTVRATIEWAGTRPTDYEWKAGLKAEREMELLKSLNDRISIL